MNTSYKTRTSSLSSAMNKGPFFTIFALLLLTLALTTLDAAGANATQEDVAPMKIVAMVAVEIENFMIALILYLLE